ncbi:hypothetical protein [Bradyrhizobium liaoningense]|uniref:hypothetical protein n=1 Tax=Bradyrhizobium liaoningense TaxID=43992 RepID=UPI001BAC191B|nr:hypothetical protein [Bradyrhizobium liaoningense]MBR1071010.1 hypothetical protein [Bradyrhizobium liaoningense]
MKMRKGATGSAHREAFALPCLCYAEDGWQRRGMISGPPGWAVCHDTAREPRMFLGYLHSDDVRLLNHEFGLHRRDFLGHQLQFKDSIAGRALKQIMLHDPVRATLFRKADASLDNWAEQVASEEPASPTRLAIQRRELTREASKGGCFLPSAITLSVDRRLLF